MSPRLLQQTLFLLMVLIAMMMSSLAAQAAAVAKVRGGDHPTFSRIVFELDKPADYSASAQGGRIVLVIKRDVAISQAALAALGIKRARDFKVNSEGQSTRVSWNAPEGASVKHYSDGATLVIDTVDGSKPKVQDIAPAAARDDYVDAQVNTLKKLASTPPPPKPVPPKAVDVSKPLVSKALDAVQTVRDQRAAITVEVSTLPVGGGVQLTYRFPERVAAAAIQRGSTLMVAFAGNRLLSHPPLEKATGDRLRSVDQRAIAGHDLLTFELRPGQFVGFRRDENAWLLSVKDTEVLPRESLTLERQADDVGGTRIFAKLPEPSEGFVLDEPATRQRLLVVPTTAASRGMLSAVRKPGGVFLPTLQGLAYEFIGDRPQTLRYPNGIAFLGIERKAPADEARGARKTLDGSLHKDRLVDLAAWAKLGDETMHARKVALLYALSMAGEAERQARRWDLARFYLGQRLPQDAIGVLDAMVRTDSDLLNAPTFRATRGVARLMANDIPGALDDLDRPLLDEEPDLWLWRARALEAAGRSADALKAYTAGADVLAAFPPRDQAEFQLAAIRADLRQGTDAQARKIIDDLPAKGLSADQRTQIAYWHGKLAERSGDAASAAASYAKAVTLGGREYGAHAAYAQIADDLNRKAITAKQAIDRLERLRFTWRGDDLELSMLDMLSRLYEADGDYRQALNLMKQAVSYFPPSDETQTIGTRLDSLFRRLFLDGEADKLPPARAVALFYDYRDLTPLGPDGDSMIRRLVERLVSVNLLERAAGLLDHQVRFRLDGVPQAVVAGRLAMIHILNNTPDKALAVIRATRQDNLPADVRQERNRIEAQALINLARADEAEVVLDSDTSRAADLLRADIFWQSKRWDDLIPVLSRLVETPDAPFNGDAKRLVLRAAVAQTMRGDEAALVALRSRFRSRMTGDALGAAFDIITAPTPDPNAVNSLSETLKAVDSIDATIAGYRAAFRQSPPQRSVQSAPGGKAA